MASKFYLRIGAGRFAYVVVRRDTGKWDAGACDNHGSQFITERPRKEWLAFIEQNEIKGGGKT